MPNTPTTTTVTAHDIETGKRPELIAYLKSVDAYQGHSRDGLPELRDHARSTFNRLRYTERPADPTNLGEADPTEQVDETVSDEFLATSPAQRAISVEPVAPVPDPATDPAWQTPAPVASDDRLERMTLAKDEHRAMTAWVTAGKIGDRPATPNLDAMNADYAAGTRSTKKAGKGKGAGRQVAPRRAEANAIAAKGKRGAGRRIGDTELHQYIAEVVAEHPQATRNDELEYAYWVAGLAVTRARWNTAWAAVEADPEAVRVAAGDETPTA